MSETLILIEKTQLASILIQRKLRLSIIGSMINIDVKKLRKLWKEINGVSPSHGKLPESVFTFLKKNQKASAQISAFLNVYFGKFKDSDRQMEIDVYRFINSHRICSDLGLDIDINFAYYGIRDVIHGNASFPVCSVCRTRFLFDAYAGGQAKRCPFCKTSPI